MLFELSTNAGRVLTYEHLLKRVWDVEGDAEVRPMPTVISRLRCKLGDVADDPAYIFNEPRVGYKMPRGGTRERGRSERQTGRHFTTPTWTPPGLSRHNRGVRDLGDPPGHRLQT